MGRPRNDLTIYERTLPWWDRRDPLFRLLAALVPARLRYLERVVPDWSGLDVLDVGCGGGLVALPVARRGGRVTGVDRAAGALAAARAQAHSENLSLTLLEGRAEQLPVPDAGFDLAICTDVLVHVDDPQRVIAEVGRALRPGGVFFWSSMQRGRLATFVAVTLGEDLLGLVHRGTHDPSRFLDGNAFEQWLQRAGLEPRARQGLGPVGWRNGTVRFGRWPVAAFMAQGHAVRVGHRG